MKRPRHYLSHYFGSHNRCSPRICKPAARLCNKAESEIRMEQYREMRAALMEDEFGIIVCPSCGGGRTFPDHRTNDIRWCDDCGADWPVLRDED
jgi:hypothetical protein